MLTRGASRVCEITRLEVTWREQEERRLQGGADAFQHKAKPQKDGEAVTDLERG